MGVLMKSKQRTLLSCAIGSVLGIGGAAALAQETSRTSVLEEVVVTAEKREANIQDVPVAVSAYTSERRDVLGLNTVEDFARFTPSRVRVSLVYAVTATGTSWMLTARFSAVTTTSSRTDVRDVS